MNKELQDKAWSVLPKEFKEEVKKLYREFAFTREGYYVELFGLHNLTSDVEGEEMLSIERILIQSYYNAHKNSRDILYDLFGPKCLRDEPASEPKSETDKHFDNILKDSFRNGRRLNIAAMAMQGILSNPTAMNGPKLIDGDEEIVAKWSLKFADALIAECEQTEKLKEN